MNFMIFVCIDKWLILSRYIHVYKYMKTACTRRCIHKFNFTGHTIFSIQNWFTALMHSVNHSWILSYTRQCNYHEISFEKVMTWEVIPGSLHFKAITFTSIPIPGSYKMSKSQTSMCVFSHLGSTCCTTGEIQGHGLIRPRVNCLQNTNKCWVFLLMSKLCYVTVKHYITGI